MKIKNYILRFIKDSSTIKEGMNISCSGLMPINKHDFGYVEEIKHNPLGFTYGIRKLDDNRVYYRHTSTIKPILPVLVSNEAIEKGDMFYLNTGEIHKCLKIDYDNELMLERVIGSNGIGYLKERVKKVIAGPNEIGWGYNEGPPHDHNRNWKFDDIDKKHLYLEDYLPSMIHNAVKNGCKLFVVVEEICPHYEGKHVNKDCSCKSGFILAPKLYEGKVIMDAYGLLKKSTSGHILKY